MVEVTSEEYNARFHDRNNLYFITITVIGMVALPDVLSAWSAMRMNEIWKEKEENENDF